MEITEKLPIHAKQLTQRFLEYGTFDYRVESSKYLSPDTGAYKYQSLVVLWGVGVRIVVGVEDATDRVASVKTTVHDGDGHNAKRTYSSADVTNVTDGPVTVDEELFREVLLELDRNSNPVVKHLVLGMGCLDTKYLYYINDAMLESEKEKDKAMKDVKHSASVTEAALQRKIESLQLQVFKLSK